ncbi:TPA: hypothetical protein ACP41M_001106 [Klebsiella aerogenes]
MPNFLARVELHCTHDSHEYNMLHVAMINLGYSIYYQPEGLGGAVLRCKLPTAEYIKTSAPANLATEEEIAEQLNFIYEEARKINPNPKPNVLVSTFKHLNTSHLQSVGTADYGLIDPWLKIKER